MISLFLADRGGVIGWEARGPKSAGVEAASDMLLSREEFAPRGVLYDRVGEVWVLAGPAERDPEGKGPSLTSSMLRIGTWGLLVPTSSMLLTGDWGVAYGEGDRPPTEGGGLREARCF